MSLLSLLKDAFGKPASDSPPEAEAEFLLDFEGRDFWTLRNAFEGTAIFGATGSGKTSGSGQALAISLLKSGFGGLVLTVKTDECELWRQYAAAAGVPPPIIFGPTAAASPYRFNFLEYERRANEQHSDGTSFTDNLVALFSSVIEVASRESGSQGNQDAYWKQTLKQLLRNAIDLLIYAGKELTFRAIYDIVVSAPVSLMPFGSEEYLAWKRGSFCGQAIAELEKMHEADPRFSDAELTHSYWTREFSILAPNTRSIIVSYFTSMADPFLRGNLKELFSSPVVDRKNELNPERTHTGEVIILNLPVKVYHEMGQFSQTLYKFIWQRAAERRNPKAPGQKPIFLWIDEAQFFVNSNDMLFMTTARSKKVAAIYLTQNISNYYAIMPGDKGRAETDALLGNFNTKIFHANGDSVTNVWAADLIGKALLTRTGSSSSVASSNSQFGFNESQVVDYQIQPVTFTTLLKGGEENDLQVTGVIFQTGKLWSNGKNHLEIQFTQADLPDPPPVVPAGTT